MKFGVHASIAGGVQNAPENARKVGSETFQLFSRSPRGGKSKISKEQIKLFCDLCKKYNFDHHYIHAPYYINLASKNNKIYFGSISSLIEELKTAEILGTNFVITHIGSARDMDLNEAIEKVIKAIEKIAKKISPKKLLLELSAGQGAIIGNSFEQLAKIIDGVKKHKIRLGGICFDTCHAFVSGYDIQTKEGLDKTLRELDKELGIDQLKVIHLNDSKFGLGEHKDRHEHIGKGKIGMAGFKVILSNEKLKNFDFILETPKDSDEDDIRNLNILKRLRDEIFGN